MGLQLMMVFGEIIVAMAATALGQALPGCQERCGDVNVPYPFGIGDGCYNHEWLNLSCNTRSTTPILRIFNSRFRVTNISLEGQVSILSRIGYACYDKSGSPLSDSYKPTFQLPKNAYTISSTLNKLTVVGCDSSGAIQWGDYATGCTSKCDKPDFVATANCSGFGCCQTSIPEEVKYYTSLNAGSFNNHTKVWSFSRCTFAFIVEADKFIFSRDYLRKTAREFFRLELPTAIDWTIGSKKCDRAKNKPGFACSGKSECYTPESIDYGYRCRCLEGYEGNPYIKDGCRDINECKNDTLHECISAKNCHNNEGSYSCSCPRGYHGDGRVGEGAEGCTPDQSHDDQSRLIKIVASVAIIVTVLLICSTWLYLEYKKRKLAELQHKFYVQNGGELLGKKLQERGASLETTRILKKPEELKKATDNYDKSRVIGRGGFGTVYRGTLDDGRTVAIKISKMGHPSLEGQFIVEKSQNEDYQKVINQFIVEVVVLSTINHRNVVKLLGCCLETQDPVLVYEFFSKGNLFNHIHDKSLRSEINWETRLMIATGTAKALSYLHSEASDSIIHGDVKSANILLDDDFTAKVIDFGSSRFVAPDLNQLVTTVQGTQGYLDPEYLQTQQLTKESDVYSFGVVLVELLTGKVANSFKVHGNEGTLVGDFLSSLEKNLFPNGFDEYINKENEEQLMKAAYLAKKCLSVKKNERPTMAAVITKLTEIQNGKREIDASTHELNPVETVSREIENDVGPSMPSPQELNPEETEYVFDNESTTSYP
ncbi:hypothetical protein F0562_028082 [Nyssa sinensis]|uniref:Protein kinase domain-containing protein n=1 Tax=Nyssa sinensis TaxID=561372 RepID=A0A5J5B8X7_9ASTE|nr:hypothetical protein F0562_028082 [Nyssa sinensis]